MAELTPDKKDFILTYVVEEGPRYKFGDVKVESQLRDFDGDRLAAQLPMKRGDWYNAKLVEDTNTAIREYQQALALEDDPHTHKLLAIELATAGYLSEAISEFRLAQQGGEPDDSIQYRLGLLLERLNQEGQARLEFQDFLLTTTCTQQDLRCEEARNRLERR